MKSARRICTLIALSTIAAPAVSEDRIRLEDAYNADAFVNYVPYQKDKIEKAEKKETPKPPPPAPNKQAEQTEPKGKELVNVQWLRANYPKLEEAAIDDPDNKDKMNAYLYTKRIILDKGQRFSSAVMETYRTDPLLNENNRIPYASGGARMVRRANILAEQQAVKELAQIGGALLFVDGRCRFCNEIVPVMENIKGSYDLPVIVISIDGSRPEKYKGEMQIDNGLFRRIGLRLTPSVVYVPHPKAYQDTDPNQYYIVSQGYYTPDEMTKQLAFIGHRQKLLSDDVRRDLAIWDRGVVASEDLQSLTLDLSRPQDFKTTLEPLLLKQY